MDGCEDKAIQSMSEELRGSAWHIARVTCIRCYYYCWFTTIFTWVSQGVGSLNECISATGQNKTWVGKARRAEGDCGKITRNPKTQWHFKRKHFSFLNPSV